MLSRNYFRCILTISALAPLGLMAQNARAPRALITAPVDETNLQRLAGNTRPEAKAQNDVGAVADDFAMEHMLLQLKRPAEQEAAAAAAVDALSNPKSPTYHKWLTSAQFGQAFGPAQSDIDTVTAWLQSKGFTVHSVYPNRMTIDFSGDAGHVRTAFHTEIHRLNVNGESHVANMSDPQIPAALASAVKGVVSMHDFKAHPMKSPKNARPQYTFTSQGYQTWVVTPAD